MRVDLSERLDYNTAGSQFIVAADFSRSEGASHRYRPAEIIGMRGTHQRNLSTSLGEGHGVTGMRVNHRPDAAKRLQQSSVGRSVG